MTIARFEQRQSGGYVEGDWMEVGPSLPIEAGCLVSYGDRRNGRGVVVAVTGEIPDEEIVLVCWSVSGKPRQVPISELRPALDHAGTFWHVFRWFFKQDECHGAISAIRPPSDRWESYHRDVLERAHDDDIDNADRLVLAWMCAYLRHGARPTVLYNENK